MTTPLHEVRREDLISRQAAAKQLGIHPNTMDNEAKKLGLTKYRVVGDSRIFFHRDAIGAIDLIDVVEGD